MIKIILLAIGLIMVSCDTAEVAHNEFGAEASLKKYEWFKDASNTIIEKQNTVLIYEAQLNQLISGYDGVPRSKWDRLDKQQYNQWSLEIAGIKASCNAVIREYNSQSNKFNWEMYSNSDLPKEYSNYIIK